MIKKPTVSEFGFAWHRQVINEAVCQPLAQAIHAYQDMQTVVSIRHAEQKLPTINIFARSSLITQIAEHYIHGTAQLVRAIVFDKNSSENWLVAWHQDKTITVNKKHDIQGWGRGHSRKAFTTFNRILSF